MDRQHAFHQLKQPCIQLLQATASIGQKPHAKSNLIEGLIQLQRSLQNVNPESIDARLAEYVFVPISQVLRISRQIPVRGLELSLQCISTLLRTGWGSGLDSSLSGQLLILFTFLSKPSSAENGINMSSEELQSLAFQCTADLLTANGYTQQGKQAITATENIPALGEAILIILDSIRKSPYNVKLQAISALGALNNAMDDDEALAGFLPGIVSCLTTLLAPSSSSRPNYRIMERGLEILTSILSRLLSDKNVKDLPANGPPPKSGREAAIVRSELWLQATALQMKVALASILKIRNHDKIEVRKALLALCLCIIQDCRHSLDGCMSMVLETMISLVSHAGSQDLVESKLRSLISLDVQLSDVLRECLHGWLVSLPRLMQSKDDIRRHQAIHQISVTFRLFDQELTTFDEILVESLRGGVSSVFLDSECLGGLDHHSSAVTDRVLVLSSPNHSEFLPLEMRSKGQEDVLKGFKLLIRELARSDAALKVAQKLITTFDTGVPEERIASLWISVNMLKDVTTSNPSIAEFTDLGKPDLRGEVLDNLYSASLKILHQEGPVTNASWPFIALALEVVALQASKCHSGFRAELSEVTYPLLDYLGSPHAALRKHAITCLNIVSKTSGYSNAAQLIIENVDYIVNAIGLRLAFGDVSPQAPQVLLMMIQMSGPSLLPYLDDLVEGIFNALKRYHGYPKLVELLFLVLKAMAKEGVETSDWNSVMSNRQRQTQRQEEEVTVVEVVHSLKQLKMKLQKQAIEEVKHKPEPCPETPWNKGIQGVPIRQDEPNLENIEQSLQPKREGAHPSGQRIYTMLLNISLLTQHHLTTPSATLRSSLLSLLSTTLPYLAKHEDSFLPLVHTLWPVLLPRLEDPEAFIVSHALEVMRLMCEYAGNFMRTRIEETWELLRKVYGRIKVTLDRRAGLERERVSSVNFGALATGMSMNTEDLEFVASSRDVKDIRSGNYIDAPTKMVWASYVELLCSIARFVTIKEERGDEVLKILSSELNRKEVRMAIECWNADSVWLTLHGQKG